MDKKKNKKNRDIKNSVIDLTSYITPEMANLDENGSYTGMTRATYYGEDLEEPVQDADDL
ncbi:MAG: hypothetical protein NC397_01910 [Clostridium sp.]|nr:hypothetical protein [Clostridium sp.]